MRTNFPGRHLNLRSLMSQGTACPCLGSLERLERLQSPPMSLKRSGWLFRYHIALIYYKYSNHECQNMLFFLAFSYSQSVSNSWQTVADHLKATQFTVKSLRPNTIYLFMVRAVNSHGLSDPSPISDPVRTQGVLTNAIFFTFLSASLRLSR